MTAAGVLILAIMGGAVGVALVGHGTSPAPAVTFDQAAQTTAKQSPTQRAVAAAKRAEKAAARAEKAAKSAESAAERDTVPVTTTEPTPWMENPAEGAECRSPGARAKWDNGPWLICQDGTWVRDEAPADPAPSPTPAP